MDKLLQLLLLIGGGFALYFGINKANAAAYGSSGEIPGSGNITYEPILDASGNIVEYQPIYHDQYTGSDLPADASGADPLYVGGPDLTAANNADSNLTAFLAVIRKIESSDDYTALSGGAQWAGGLADHPVNLGWDWRKAGAPSSAAGAYQIVIGTWNEMKQRAQLPDFSPVSQDAAAIGLITKRGAMPSVQSGNFDFAARKLVGEWDAFRRIFAGTYPINIEGAKQIFVDNGGVIAT